MPIKEECSLCGKVLPYYSLKRCFRCKRLYCGTCIEYAEDGNVVCLNCARRIVSPIRLGTKYSPLTRYLARRAQYTDTVALLFHQIEGIIGNSLPANAFQNAEWWKNSHTASQQKAWLDVGWHVEGVDIEKRTVTFRREKGIRLVEKKPKERMRSQKKAQKLLPMAEPRKRRIPSKTKMSKMVGRLKNIERRRLTPRTYPGQPKSRSSHEKRLFKKQA
jgi:hypothetical protein